jgi:hypothetical protein
MYGNLTSLQYWDCHYAGHSTSNSRICIFDDSTDPLTPAERLECENKGHEPEQRKDKDTKE